MSLANALTVLRVALIPVLLAVLLVPGLVPEKELVAAVITVLAGISDSLDGYFARRRQQVTTVGTLLDPIADKLLISAALLALVELQAVRAWMAFVILGREFAISGLRNVASAEGLTISASGMAKAKMVSQVIAVVAVMVGMRFPSLRLVGTLMLWLVVVFAVISAFGYFRKFWGEVEKRLAQRQRQPQEAFNRRKTDVAAS